MRDIKHMSCRNVIVVLRSGGSLRLVMEKGKVVQVCDVEHLMLHMLHHDGNVKNEHYGVLLKKS